jgi:hypothetical protein
MTFFAFVWLFSLTVLLPIVIIKMQTDLKRQRLDARRPDSDALSVGELKRIIHEAVAEETAALTDRIDALERGLLLPPADSAPLRDYDEETEGDEWAGPEKSLGRRAPS